MLLHVASYVLYVCVLLHSTLFSWWVGWSYFTKTTCTCSFIWQPVVGSVRLVYRRTCFKHPVTNCFATDRSKVVTPRFLIFVNCLWRPLWNWLLYNRILFSSLFVSVWGCCVCWMWPFLIGIFHCFHYKSEQSPILPIWLRTYVISKIVFNQWCYRLASLKAVEHESYICVYI
jgi:ABC-type phosphate/phosphonate transport system permease subunit